MFNIIFKGKYENEAQLIKGQELIIGASELLILIEE